MLEAHFADPFAVESDLAWTKQNRRPSGDHKSAVDRRCVENTLRRSGVFHGDPRAGRKILYGSPASGLSLRTRYERQHNQLESMMLGCRMHGMLTTAPERYWDTCDTSQSVTSSGWPACKPCSVPLITLLNGRQPLRNPSPKPCLKGARHLLRYLENWHLGHVALIAIGNRKECRCRRCLIRLASLRRATQSCMPHNPQLCECSAAFLQSTI